MARIVLADASPLIGLARVDGIDWLAPIFGEVWVPIEVYKEVVSGSGAADEPIIQAAVSKGTLKIWPHEAPVSPDLPDLDEGEAACIRIGLSQDGPALILMDERAGRSIACEHGLRVAGTAAVIVMAKIRGLIPSAKAVFARLHASDFRIAAPVINAVLERVGEATAAPRS